MRAPSLHLMRPVVCLLLLLPLAAAAQSSAGWPRTVRDDAGSILTLAEKPRRIVSATLPTDEILLGLVGTERLAAITAFASDPALSLAASQARSVAVKLAQLNVEVVISLAPDIVFAASWTDPSLVRQLREAGLTVYL